MNGLTVIRNYCSFLLVFILVLNLPVQAQQNAFLHIQTENNQVFEVKWNGKNYASSSSGHLLLPQVAAGDQLLSIFTGGETMAGYTFTLAIGKEPKAYSLRQEVDNSWSLFDMVSFHTTKGIFIDPVAKTKPTQKTQEPASNPVVQDKPAEKTPVQPGETPVVKTGIPVVVKPKTPAVTGILKIFDKTGSGGIDQVYVLTHETRSDTIALFIPVLTEEIPKTGTHPAASVNGKKKTTQTRPPYNVPAAILQRYPSFSK